MDIFVISILAIVAVVLSLVVKKNNKEIAFAIAVISVILILMSVLDDIYPVINQMRSIFEGGIIDGFYIDVLIKAVGIGILGQIISSLCKDAGETALANVIELAAKVLIIIISVPIITSVLEFLTEILRN